MKPNTFVSEQLKSNLDKVYSLLVKEFHIGEVEENSSFNYIRFLNNTEKKKHHWANVELQVNEFTHEHNGQKRYKARKIYFRIATAMKLGDGQTVFYMDPSRTNELRANAVPVVLFDTNRIYFGKTLSVHYNHDFRTFVKTSETTQSQVDELDDYQNTKIEATTTTKVSKELLTLYQIINVKEFDKLTEIEGRLSIIYTNKEVDDINLLKCPIEIPENAYLQNDPRSPAYVYISEDNGESWRTYTIENAANAYVGFTPWSENYVYRKIYNALRESRMSGNAEKLNLDKKIIYVGYKAKLSLAGTASTAYADSVKDKYKDRYKEQRKICSKVTKWLKTHEGEDLTSLQFPKKWDQAAIDYAKEKIKQI